MILVREQIAEMMEAINCAEECLDKTQYALTNLGYERDRKSSRDLIRGIGETLIILNRVMDKYNRNGVDYV